MTTTVMAASFGGKKVRSSPTSRRRFISFRKLSLIFYTQVLLMFHNLHSLSHCRATPFKRSVNSYKIITIKASAFWGANYPNRRGRKKPAKKHTGNFLHTVNSKKQRPKKLNNLIAHLESNFSENA